MVEKGDQDTKQQQKWRLLFRCIQFIHVFDMESFILILTLINSLHCTQHDLDITRRMSVAARTVVSRPSCFGEVHRESTHLPEE